MDLEHCLCTYEAAIEKVRCQGEAAEAERSEARLSDDGPDQQAKAHCNARHEGGAGRVDQWPSDYIRPALPCRPSITPHERTHSNAERLNAKILPIMNQIKKDKGIPRGGAFAMGENILLYAVQYCVVARASTVVGLWYRVQYSTVIRSYARHMFDSWFDSPSRPLAHRRLLYLVHVSEHRTAYSCTAVLLVVLRSSFVSRV